MSYTFLLTLLIAFFGGIIVIQAYRLYTISREWGYGEIVVRWVAPDEIKTILYIAAALIAIIVAIAIRSEALLSALAALLIGLGGMLSQLTFINVIGKKGIFLGRIRKGFTWDEINQIILHQKRNLYVLEIQAALKEAPPRKGFMERLQKELESLEEVDELEEIFTSQKKEQVKERKEEIPNKRDKKTKEKKRTTDDKKTEKITQQYQVSFKEKQQYALQQALLYYYPKGYEFRN